jgi:phosphohistidine phosphatase SixA
MFLKKLAHFTQVKHVKKINERNPETLLVGHQPTLANPAFA